MKKFRTVWCFLDGKKHCDVIAWALAANCSLDEAKDRLRKQYPSLNVTFKVI